MTDSVFDTNHPLAVKLWSKKLAREAQKATYFARFMGTSANSLIHVKTETGKDAGDRIRVGLRVLLSGDGVQGDGTLEGNEEALTTHEDDLLIDQQRHAVRSAGRMTEQRVTFSLREEARSGLTDWWAERYDVSLFNHLCGFIPATAVNTLRGGNNAVIAPDASHEIRAGAQATDEALTTNDTFDLSLIDACVETAQTVSPLIRPVSIPMVGPRYVMFLHPFQVTALRTNTTTGQWLDIQKAAMSGGEISNNPIYTGALGEYNGTILHNAFWITQGVNSTTDAAIAAVRRAVFCGAQAACVAWGRKNSASSMFDWAEELFDYGNKLGVSAGSIFGVKKTRFNSADYATITVPTYAVASA